MKREKILVTGASGMVGSRFVETFPQHENLLTPDLDVFDLTRAETVAAFFANHPDIGAVVNFAAYTNVSEAQKQKGDETALCYQLNVVGTQNLIDQIKGRAIYLIHISTDMVFPGDKADPGPYTEGHPVRADVNRLTWYGYTKALAERAVISSLPSVAILRLIYPVVAAYDLKLDYLRAPLAYFEKNKSLYPIYDDQRMNITDVDEICLCLRRLLEKQPGGIFHTGSSDITTPYEIMAQLFNLVYGNHEMVSPGKTDTTRYPLFGGLLNQETQRQLGIRFASSSQIISKLYGR